MNAIRTRTVARSVGRTCHRSTRFDHLTVQIIPGIGDRQTMCVGRVGRCGAACVGGTHGAMVLVGAGRTPQIRIRRARLVKTSVAGDGLNAIRTRTVARFGGRTRHRSTCQTTRRIESSNASMPRGGSFIPIAAACTGPYFAALSTSATESNAIAVFFAAPPPTVLSFVLTNSGVRLIKSSLA